MHVFKRANSPYWQTSYRDPVTQAYVRQSSGKKTKAEAQEWLRKTIAKRTELAQDAPNGIRPITLKDALTLYLQAVQSHSKDHRAKVELMRRKTLGEPLATDDPDKPPRWAIDGSRLIHTLDSEDMEMLRLHRQREGNAAATICHELQNIRASCLYAMRMGRRGPVDMFNHSHRQPWRMPKIVVKTRYLSREEWGRLYAELSPSNISGPTSDAVKRHLQSNQDIAVALVCTGCRWGEIRRLQWKDVDLEKGLITVWGNKTGRERMVGIPTMLRTVLERRKAVVADMPNVGKLPVFPGVKLTEFRNPGSCAPILRAMNKLGFNDPETVRRHGKAVVHSLRHTFATWAVDDKADLGDVQAVLGHSTPAMTNKYAHRSKAAAAQRLACMFDGNADKGA